MTAQPHIVIVVPTVRQDCMQRFLDAWEPEFARSDRFELIVVEDNPERSFELSTEARLTHYSWRDIDERFGDDSWIVPRRTDCVRSFGYHEAWTRQPDMIVTLDDDCLPESTSPIGFLDEHWQRLESGGSHDAWISTTTGTIPRGVPYEARERQQRCVINHGLWEHVIDYDAVTQLQQLRNPTDVAPIDQTIPRGHYYPMCGMNLAWRPEITPALYFLLMGRDHGVDRFGDIWAGLLSKRICDHLGFAINSGSPMVHHARASNVWSNLRKEAPGMERNETMWRIVDETLLTGTTVVDCYRELAAAIEREGQTADDAYLVKLANAMQRWASRFTRKDLNLPRPTSDGATASSAPTKRANAARSASPTPSHA